MSRKIPTHYLTRLARWATALAGVGLAATAPLHAQSVDPSAAPAEWVRYAEAATVSVMRLLEAETETAMRLRTYLDATRSAPDQPTAPLIVKLWIDADGTVARIEHPPFAYVEANADLRAVIVGQGLSESPPKDMLLPLRVRIELPPVHQDAGDPKAASGDRVGGRTLP